MHYEPTPFERVLQHSRPRVVSLQQPPLTDALRAAKKVKDE